jgi:peroxiredoxin
MKKPATVAALAALGIWAAGLLPARAAAQQNTQNAAATDDATALVGRSAPAWTLPDQNDKARTLAESRGKWVVLAFYPADATPGCTLQNRSYSANAAKFAPLNAAVYTVSTQDTKSKQAFCAKEGLTHTLLSDVGGKTALAYNVLLPGGVARRVTFYIDPEGRVAHVDAKPAVANAADDSVAILARLAAKAPATERRDPVGSTEGKPVVTEKKPNRFVGPADARVTMDALVPDFGLPDARTGKTVALTSVSAGKKATVLVFVSTQCPVSNAYNTRMARLAADYGPKGVAVVGINSNAPEATAAVAAHADKNGLTFPVLRDADGAIAARFGATKTPEAYVIDDNGLLVYHGAIDDAQNAAQVKTRPLAAALDALVAGKPVTVKTTKAFGCAIKRAGL